MLYLAVGTGGILGALLRYYLGVSVHAWWALPFPLATLVTNFIGCFVLGWFTTRVARLGWFPAWIRLGFGTGVVGSFTTFSTFSVETFELIRQGLWGTALLYVLLSLWGGLFLAWAGCRIAQLPLKKNEREWQTP
ncbi:fluoride efflux transporter CrcB [Effusibacillus pohliae]|uniref:fluoride efflux transporter CrcB n=1 Tax=Effusibacillus pohliae TaxID=232270 RepID=UPI00037646F8|nr:fluoride efflux transporter CrcB [Effusibacillus pohliae]